MRTSWNDTVVLLHASIGDNSVGTKLSRMLKNAWNSAETNEDLDCSDDELPTCKWFLERRSQHRQMKGSREHNSVKPFYRLQSDSSHVCSLAAATAAIAYTMCRRQVVSDDHLTKTPDVVNIGRHIRNTLSDTRSFDQFFGDWVVVPCSICMYCLSHTTTAWKVLQ
jgi:hypothetical protein